MSWADLNLMPALPEIFLLTALSVILVLDLFLSDAKRGITYRVDIAHPVGLCCADFDYLGTLSRNNLQRHVC